jgi:hypothetical protein
MFRKIGLLNHMGGGNLGDDATQDAVIENIKRRWPEAVILAELLVTLPLELLATTSKAEPLSAVVVAGVV